MEYYKLLKKMGSIFLYYYGMMTKKLCTKVTNQCEQCDPIFNIYVCINECMLCNGLYALILGEGISSANSDHQMLIVIM